MAEEINGIKRPPPIKCRTYINADPERIYQTLTTGEGWDCWFTRGTEVDARQGGHIVLRWVDWGVDHYTNDAGGPVVEAEPPVRFAFQWNSGDSKTTITFVLRPHGQGTIVQVEETGYTMSERDMQALVECASGWGEALALLKVYLEHGVIYGPVPEAESV